MRGADIVVAAAGSPGLVRGDWVKPGAVVIEVGIKRIDAPGKGSRIISDVVFDEMDHAGAITPASAGVRPMTVACLLRNTLRAARGRPAAVADADLIAQDLIAVADR